MGSRGPRPKRERSQERKTRARLEEFTTVAVDGQVRGPDLPEGDWPEQTRRWWQTWRTSAQAQEFAATDWDYLLDTALLHRALWTGDIKAAGELRIRVSKFGATDEDRDRLRLRIDQDAEQVARPSRMDDQRRRRLLRAVTDEQEK